MTKYSPALKRNQNAIPHYLLFRPLFSCHRICEFLAEWRLALYS